MAIFDGFRIKSTRWSGKGSKVANDIIREAEKALDKRSFYNAEEAREYWTGKRAEAKKAAKGLKSISEIKNKELSVIDDTDPNDYTFTVTGNLSDLAMVDGGELNGLTGELLKSDNDDFKAFFGAELSPKKLKKAKKRLDQIERDRKDFIEYIIFDGVRYSASDTGFWDMYRKIRLEAFGKIGQTQIDMTHGYDKRKKDLQLRQDYEKLYDQVTKVTGQMTYSAKYRTLTISI